MSAPIPAAQQLEMRSALAAPYVFVPGPSPLAREEAAVKARARRIEQTLLPALTGIITALGAIVFIAQIVRAIST
ncbi:hypothetical protein [Novosphingobium mangrovi (ex Hu et al. 2023)]|uniref:Uncharacterized protein n=1 Tax=Novosphingobium mangrovi (ex Hu et al. 2023) TaxID=2930094 RepID=A0ABT0A8Y4_9SPHN|nr:hypothetical protein [Novosphingobium mangrovi (ex Hu et al. 2023)]MCJ1959624.1 hypothetical protein [Novosphingobium mangrovi (ex Hu et al. 2023)]